MPLRIRSKGSMCVMSSPKKRIRPEVGGKSPVMALNKVVLPAPFAPRMARFSPASTDKLTSSTARNAPNARVTPSRTSASEDMSGTSPACGGRGITAVVMAERNAVMDAIFVSPAYLRQSGMSRVPRPIFLNSASGRPRVWVMLGTVLTTLLNKEPSAALVTSVM